MRRSKMEPGLEERLRECSRLSPADKPVLAANLGLLAERVNPQDPLDGARQLAERAGIEGVWVKRKRYFRLPGELAPPAEKDGAYASGGATFLKLAEAAGAILAPPGNPQLTEIETSSAVRTLVHGSSFLPVWMPSEPGDRPAKGLLDEYAARIAAKVAKETNLADLWAILRDTPISVEAFDKDELDALPPSPFGKASEFPSELLHPDFRKFIVAGRFEAGGRYLNWAEPSLEIGRATFKHEVPMLIIPEEKRHLFLGDYRDDLSREAVDWMIAQGLAAETTSPSKHQDTIHDCGWNTVSVWSTLNVAIEIVQGEDRDPALRLNTYGDCWLSIGDGGGLVGFVGSNNDLILEGAGDVVQHTNAFGDFDGHDPWRPLGDHVDLVHASPFRRSDLTLPAVVGVLQADWTLERDTLTATMGTSGWTDDPKVAELLIGEAALFDPILPQCEPEAGALRQGSVGSALMYNALKATPENRISDRLVARARLAANAGLRFHEAMVETYRNAIRRL